MSQNPTTRSVITVPRESYTDAPLPAEPADHPPAGNAPGPRCICCGAPAQDVNH